MATPALPSPTSCTRVQPKANSGNYINQGSLVHDDNWLSIFSINDRVISANNISLEGVDYATAVQVLRDSGQSVNLVVKRRVVLPPTIPASAAILASTSGGGIETKSMSVSLNRSRKKEDFGVILGCKIFIKDIVSRTVADKSGNLKPGDYVTRINGTDLDGLTLKEARKLVETSKDRLDLLIKRSSGEISTSVKPSPVGVDANKNAYQQPQIVPNGEPTPPRPPLPSDPGKPNLSSLNTCTPLLSMSCTQTQTAQNGDSVHSTPSTITAQSLQHTQNSLNDGEGPQHLTPNRSSRIVVEDEVDAKTYDTIADKAKHDALDESDYKEGCLVFACYIVCELKNNFKCIIFFFQFMGVLRNRPICQTIYPD